MKILLYNIGYRGDILVVGQNFSRELHLRYPQAALDLMLHPRMREAQDFLEPLALYRQFLFGEKRDFHSLKGEYDLAFIIDENIYPEGHLRTIFTLAGFQFRHHPLTFATRENDDKLAGDIARQYRRPLIATQVDMARKWPRAKAEELWKRLSDIGSLLTVGPGQTFPGCERPLTFRESAALLREADIFVGIDSGIAHAAALVGTQTVLLQMAHPENWISPTDYANQFIADDNARHVSIHPPREEFCGHYFCLRPTGSGGIARPSGNPLQVKCVWKKRLGIFKGTSCFNKISVDTFYDTVAETMQRRKLL